MRCPRLEDLPVADASRTGWPWTQEEPQPQDPDPHAWPRISVVMPCLNQAAYVEEAVRSTLLQGYPDLELVVVDGGSSDATLDILDRYRPWLRLVVEPDEGLYHALNKGIALATGEILGHLNSDDLYASGALREVARTFLEHPEAGSVCGEAAAIEAREDGEGYSTVRVWKAPPLSVVSRVMNDWTINARFFRRDALERVGTYDAIYRVCADVDFLLRAARLRIPDVTLERLVYVYRHHPGSITLSRQHDREGSWVEDSLRIAERHLAAESVTGADVRALRDWHTRLITGRLRRQMKGRHPGSSVRTFFRGWRYDASFPFRLVRTRTGGFS